MLWCCCRLFNLYKSFIHWFYAQVKYWHYLYEIYCLACLAVGAGISRVELKQCVDILYLRGICN